MKIKLTTSRIINLIIGIAVLLFSSFIILMFCVKTGTISVGSSSGSASYEKNTLPSIDPVIPDTITHHKYVHLKDSIRIARMYKNGTNIGFSMSGFIGFQRLLRCENCNFLNAPIGSKKNIEYLITFHDWKLDTSRSESFDPVIYFVKGDQSYLRKTTCKKKAGSNSTNTFTCNEKDIAVPFRIDTYDKNIMVPVSKTTYQIVRAIGIAGPVLFFIYFVYFVIGSFIQFLAEIAQGSPFSERNVKRLRFITLNLLLIPLGVFLIKLLLIPLIFHSYFTPEIVLDSDSWKSLWKPAILCLIFAALYRAFKKGKQLNEESDLTI